MANPIRRNSHALGHPEMHYFVDGQTTSGNNVLGILSLGNNYFEELVTRRKKKTKRERKSYFVVTDVHCK